MNLILLAILLAVISFIIAYYAAPYFLDWLISKSKKYGFYNGPWKTHLGIGKKETNFIEKAAIARVGLGACDSDETIYWNAFTDSEGNILRTDKEYEIVITEDLPIAYDQLGFWSITAYGDDQFLMKTETGPYLIRDSDIYHLKFPRRIRLSKRTDKCQFPCIALSSDKQKFTLALRCYRPKDLMKSYKTCSNLILPKIIAI
jgi:hypothetical protein